MSSPSAPPLPVEIAPGEDFTRFILARSHFASQKGRIKPHALLPLFNSANNRLETSTFRVSGLTIAEIWQLGYFNVEDVTQGRTIKARGTGPFSLATSQGLSLDVNGTPFPRHVDLIGWMPPDKHSLLMKATEIADKLRLEIDPRG